MNKQTKKIQEGDQVYLPSSPDTLMTVESVDELTGELTVVWLDESRKMQRTTIRASVVEVLE